MNTTLTEINSDEIEELRKDYYAEYYPIPRVEKAIFNFLDQDYYAGEDDVFYTIYKKENDWFVNREEIEKEITKMFGLHLPERIKVGPGEDDYIEPARNPIPGRVIHKWITKHQLKLRTPDFGKDIAEDLEYWGVDGDEMGPIKENTTNKLTNKFLTDFWPQYRNQVYSELYNTYHPSAYVEGFNRPSSQFENALEVVGDAVKDGKRFGLLDSSVGWQDLYHKDDRGIAPTTWNEDKEEWEHSKILTDDNGLPTLRDQLEIIDNTNLDWIHGILLFDVLEDIVDEFKSYCGENGVDESGMGKCMDDFPPSPNNEQINRTGGTLKQDYYTLYNFMKELERTGVNVKDYMKSPIFPNIIKLVDDGTTDYDITGEYSPMRQDSEAMGVPERLDGDEMGPVKEQKTSDKERERKEKLTTLKTQIDTNNATIKNIEKQIKDLEDKDDGVSYFGDKDKKKKPKGPVIGILEVDDEETQLSIDVRKAEIKALKSNIDAYKAENQYLQNQKKELDKPKPIKTDSTPTMDSDKGGEETDTSNASTTGTKKPIKISKIIDKDGVLDSEDITEQEDIGDLHDRLGIVDGEKKDDGAERLYKQHAHDNEDYVDNSPFTRKEILILKQLHKNLTREELGELCQDTPTGYGKTDTKFWQVMKLFGIEYVNDVAEDTRSSIYAKWAYDNWTEDGDYGSIEAPIKAPLKWYEIDRAETGSQIEYRDGTAEVLGFDEDDAGNRADYDFYSWGGDMETTDYGDYESYDSSIDRADFVRLDEEMDPELKYTIDQQYRTNPEMRDELLQSLEGEGDGKYYLNPEGTELNVPPIKIAQKFSDVNGYGNIKFDMQGGNGIAYFTDKDLVIKLTTDDSEYFTANKLVGTDNEYIVKVFESARIKTSHTINDDLFVVVLEALPMTEEMEKTWSECCCGKDSPVHIDYLTEPALVLPPTEEYDKCLPIYDNILGIQKNFAEYDIVWSDIGIDNMGIKNGKLAVIDLGETKGGTTKGEGITLNLENVKIRPLTKKQIQKQLVLI